MEEIRNTKKQVWLPLIIAAAVSLGIFIGAAVVEPRTVSTESSKAIAKFREVVANIDQNYVDSVNSNELVDKAIVRMLEELDPHTSYVTAKEVEIANMKLKGGYDGIGVQFDIIQDTIIVIKPNSGGPADKAGLRAGDKIIMVEDELLAGTDLRNNDVTDRLLGKEGTTVRVSVLHFGENVAKEYNITRGKIPQETVVAAYMATKDIGYIKLVSFGINSYDEFRSAIVKLKEQGMTKLVLDLQGNGGGYMVAAEKIADELIGGDKIIVSQKGKLERYTSTEKASKKGAFEDGPVIVLMDEYSASASEIVAGALQDNDRALIVGRRSYGKGLVQMPIRLIDGSELRLTIARYYTPSGRSIQKPFQPGDNADYAHDILDRYNDGEFYFEDSIHLNSELKFTTPQGRVVYGGGGIMPDNFVPYDSSINTAYYNGLMANRVLRSYTLEYYLQHRSELENMSYDDFRNNFEVSQEKIAEIIRLGQEFGVPFDQHEYKLSEEHLKAYIKAEIARLVWDDNGFYPIYNEVSNPAFKKALGLFDDARALVMNNLDQ